MAGSASYLLHEGLRELVAVPPFRHVDAFKHREPQAEPARSLQPGGVDRPEGGAIDSSPGQPIQVVWKFATPSSALTRPPALIW